MSLEIGSVEIPLILQIEEARSAETDELQDAFKNNKPIPVKHEADNIQLIITGYINEEIHSENLSLNEQKREIKSLRKSSKKDNPIDYKGYLGHLLIESVDFIDDGESRIVDEFEIEARYFPWPKYYRGETI